MTPPQQIGHQNSAGGVYIPPDEMYREIRGTREDVQGLRGDVQSLRSGLEPVPSLVRRVDDHEGRLKALESGPGGRAGVVPVTSAAALVTAVGTAVWQMMTGG